MFDARRLYAGTALASTFAYCMEVLHQSEDAAFNRIEVARAARSYPAILDMLAAGTLSPTTARMLRRHLTPENHADLLAAAAGQSKHRLEQVLAARFPQPDVPTRIRAVPERRSASGAAASADGSPTAAESGSIATDGRSNAIAGGSSVSDAAPVFATPDVVPGASALKPTAAMTSPIRTEGPVRTSVRHVVRPLSAERYEIRFTARAARRELVREAQDLLAGSVPTGDLDEIVHRAFVLLVADMKRKKAAIAHRPRVGGSGSVEAQARNTRHIPAAVRRAVWTRDGGKCTFVAAAGQCGSRRHLEYHHGPAPYGAGGKPTVDNIHLHCRAHNRYEAEAFYGPGREYGGIGSLRPSEARDGATVGVTRSGTGVRSGGTLGSADGGEPSDSRTKAAVTMPLAMHGGCPFGDDDGRDDGASATT